MSRTSGFSRRRLLSSAAGLGAYIWVPRLARAADPHQHMNMSPTLGMEPRKPQPAMDAPLIEPETRRSVNGVLQTTLRCAYAYRDIGGVRLYVRSYEGGSPGPTLRMKPGDTLKIRMPNDFPPNRDLMPMDLSNPHQFNNTNFHFHGSHSDPGGISDNVMRSMVPGETYDIEITLPEDHPKGTYWYHPHHHGSADIQVASGMVGMIVVEGDFAEVPEIAKATERVLVMTQVVHDDRGMVETFETLFPETATRFLAVNGQRRPTIAMRPGEVQRWRIVHAGYQDDMLLALEQHELHAIAYDGTQLGAMETMKTHLIVPGQRADFLIKAGDPGTYELHALPYDEGYPSPVGPLARVVVSGEPMDMKLPTSLPKPPFDDIKDSELTGHRKLVFSANAPGAAAHWREYDFLIDGKKFDPTRIDQLVKLGAVEEWTILNEDELNDHVFHIHTNPFVIVELNGKPLAKPQWRDTAAIERKGGTLTFRSRFLDYTGIFMLHCHMMNHEEMGMMQTVEVYK